MTPELNLPENEWAACGPGSAACLEQIFGAEVRGVEAEALAYLHATQGEHFARLEISDPPSMGGGRQGMSFVDLEHSLCECSKYCRYREQGAGAHGGQWAASEGPLTAD